MDWIKCADRMPPDMEPVIVTVETLDGERYTMPECRWNQELSCWEWPYEAGSGYWETVDEKVTHWMPCPGPAED